MNGSTHNFVDIKIQKPIVLIGMMGVGKTHVGRVLARKFGISFVDSDDEIATSAGQSIPDIFEFYGEAAFRDLEKKVIERLLDNKASVISTGGGCITQPDTLNSLKERSHLIWLQSDIDTLVERVSKRDDRPLLKDKDPKQVLSDLLAKREDLYAQAHFSVDASKGSDNTVHDICTYIEKLTA